MPLIETDKPVVGSLDGFKQSTALVKPGLPSFAYTSEAFWQLENSKLFPTEWILAGFAHEIAKPGDVAPVTVGDSPIVLVRNKDNKVKAFHNVCSHRCIKLVDKPHNAGRMLRCPYHTWTYGLNGELRNAPYFGGTDPKALPEGFDPKDHGLKEVNCEVWFDWIFVNLFGNAKPLEDYIAPLRSRLEGLDFEQTRLVGVIDLGVIDTNWKFLMENFIEPYHVQFVHSNTTDQPLVDHYTVIDGNCRGSAVDLDADEEGGDGSHHTLAVSSRYLTLFPTFVLGRYIPNQLGVHLNIPLGPGKTLQRRAIYMTDGTELLQEEAEALKKLWTDVHREDHEICKRLQEGRISPVAQSGGILSPYWEDSVRSFQEQVAEAVS